MSTTQAATRMEPEQLAAYLEERLGDRLLDAKITYGQLTATVEPAALPDAARLCKEDPNLACDFFDFLCGVDEREDGFSVILHVYSTRHRHHVTLRVLAAGGREEPTVPSVSGVYRGADWHERETYDMFGITFEGHPGLLPRILTVENFEGFPLRKEFLLSSREAKPWPGAKEPVEHDTEGDTEAPAQPDEAAEDKAAAAKARAERARAKAAEMRAQKAAQQEAAQHEAEGDAAAGGEEDEGTS